MNKSESKRLNIVVADDEEIYLSLVRDALEDERYNVRTASSAQDALKIIETEEINLIITDIRMPQMDGIELIKRAREINPHLMAIFMTGYANLNSAKKSRSRLSSSRSMSPIKKGIPSMISQSTISLSLMKAKSRQ